MCVNYTPMICNWLNQHFVYWSGCILGDYYSGWKNEDRLMILGKRLTNYFKLCINKYIKLLILIDALRVDIILPLPLSVKINVVSCWQLSRRFRDGFI